MIKQKIRMKCYLFMFIYLFTVMMRVDAKKSCKTRVRLDFVTILNRFLKLNF